MIRKRGAINVKFIDCAGSQKQHDLRKVGTNLSLSSSNTSSRSSIIDIPEIKEKRKVYIERMHNETIKKKL